MKSKIRIWLKPMRCAPWVSVIREYYIADQVVSARTLFTLWPTRWIHERRFN